MRKQERPANDSYYETRHELLSQGAIFRDVPLGYPLPPGQIGEDPNAPAGARQFLSGPFEVGDAMLVIDDRNGDAGTAQRRGNRNF